MKHNIILLSISALCLLTSCFKDDPQKESYDIVYYISGNEHRVVDDGVDVTIPTIFKSDKVLFQLEANSIVKDVTLKNKDVFSCGYYFLDDEILPRPRYWRNKDLVTVSLNCDHASFNGITSLDDSVYAFGNMYTEDNCCGFITKDEQVIFKSENGYLFDSFLIYPSGTLIVAGHDENAGYIWSIYLNSDKKWVADKGKVTPDDKGYTYVASEITGYRETVYVSWTRYDAKTMTGNACYSKNYSVGSSTFTVLSSQESYANSITIFNNYLYTGGYVYRNTDEKTSAMWSNEVFSDYGKELKGENYVFKTIYDGNFLHIIVANENKLLISLSNTWQGGSFEFAIPAGFEPTGLFIDYTKVSDGSGNMPR